MIVTPLKTKLIEPGAQTIFEVLDAHLPNLEENSVIAIASKIVSLCEGRVVSRDSTDRLTLVQKEADWYLPEELSSYGFQFTITGNTLIPESGIDESNSGGGYLLWPKNPQQSANEIRQHLKQSFGLKNIGVIITDSTCTPLRWGTTGIAVAYSGFEPTNSYIGQTDLFGREFRVTRSAVANGLAAAAVVSMGEGTEQTPIVIIKDTPLVKFQDRDPSPEELENFYITSKDEDLFAPFLNAVKWLPGKNKNT